MQISKSIEINYGHTLPNHFGFCSEIHGHRGKIIATVSGNIVKKKGDSSEGMVTDFKFLKNIMTEEIFDHLDHGFAVWYEDKEDRDFIIRRNKKFIITKQPPTAETLAKWAFDRLKDKMPKGVRLEKVTWYETPTSAATYIR